MTAAIALIARVFGVSPAIANIIAIVAAATLAAGAIWGGYEYIKHIGAEEVRTEIEKDNKDAVLKAITAAHSFDDCLAAGGVWDFRRQKCGRAQTGPR